MQLFVRAAKGRDTICQRIHGALHRVDAGGAQFYECGGQFTQRERNLCRHVAQIVDVVCGFLDRIRGIGHAFHLKAQALHVRVDLDDLTNQTGA